MSPLLCQPNQVQSQSVCLVFFFFLYIKIVQHSIMFFLDVPTMPNTCAFVFVVYHMCAYLFTFSYKRYMYVFIQNTSLLYIPVYLYMLNILHVISIISCSFNTFFIAFGTDVLLSLVLRTSNTFHPLCDTCKIFFDLFLCYSILSIFFIILLFFAYSSYIHNGNCHQFLVYLELVQEYYVHVFHKFPCCGDKVINESKTLDNG